MIRWGRATVAVMLGEVIPVLVLVVMVATLGPDDPMEAGEFARRTGTWVGPVVGAFTVLLLTRWAGLGSGRPVLQGFLIGLAVALIDLGILAASGEEFRWLFILSNGGKVAAGILGGWLAGQKMQRELPEGIA